VILPPEFVVYQRSVGGTEAVPEWTEAAKHNLTAAAQTALSTDARFRLVNTPQVDAANSELFREHVELFKIIALNLDGVVKPGGKPWQEVRDHADFHVGDGLKFLQTQTGARYALVIAGAQIKQTGGSIFAQVMLAGLTGVYVPGGGTYLFCGLIDLQDGRVSWYNSLQGMSIYGMGGGASVKNEVGADKLIGNLFKVYPASPGLIFATAASP
jgi:hypothetical protein